MPAQSFTAAISPAASARAWAIAEVYSPNPSERSTPGKDGMCHISELADFRVKRVEDVVKVGDMIWVKCIGVDERGKIKLSRKAAMKERDEAARTSNPVLSYAREHDNLIVMCCEVSPEKMTDLSISSC